MPPFVLSIAGHEGCAIAILDGRGLYLREVQLSPELVCEGCMGVAVEMVRLTLIWGPSLGTSLVGSTVESHRMQCNDGLPSFIVYTNM
jgi:hypothetical protein